MKKSLILASTLFLNCAERDYVNRNIGSPCNNGIESIQYYDFTLENSDNNYYTGRSVCDYDESGRVISEKYYDSINFDGNLTVEINFFWEEFRVLIEVKDYMTGHQEKDFITSRRIINLM